ncbi:lipoprotein, partial [Escherichia coli]|nr:lipoprotein [Escherichia coli]
MKGIITLTAIFAALTLAGCGEKGPERTVETPKVRVVSLEGN